MAEVTTENGMTSLGNKQLDSYYQSFIKTLPNQQISYDPVTLQEQTVESIAGQVEKYLRNYYDQSIAERKKQTTQQTAALDVDAASRGMNSSTFLSDMKNRQYMAEAADIADLNSDYNANLAQTVQNQYNQYLTNKLNVDFTNRSNQLEVDKWNASAQLALEELAYQRALEANARQPVSYGGGGSRGSGGGGGGLEATGNWWYDLNDNGQWQIYGDLNAAKADIKAQTKEDPVNGRITMKGGGTALNTVKSRFDGQY